MYLLLPYYRSFMRVETKAVLLVLFALCIFLAPLYYYLTGKHDSQNKSCTALLAARRFISSSWRSHPFQLSAGEKTALLFMVVKFFFIPVMLNFLFANAAAVMRANNLYAFLIYAIFGIDTLIFAFGYLFEFSFLQNVVKSVEHTFFGWFVALICYPPFNGIVGRYISSGANDFVDFGSPAITAFMRVLILGFLMLYLAASFALGAKASNLTNRGIVSRFPYSLIRHPAYAGKCAAWWITIIPIINVKFFFGMLFWTLVYYLRAVTEERHLHHDPHYTAYCHKVRYRFIPYIF